MPKTSETWVVPLFNRTKDDVTAGDTIGCSGLKTILCFMQVKVVFLGYTVLLAALLGWNARL